MCSEMNLKYIEQCSEMNPKYIVQCSEMNPKDILNRLMRAKEKAVLYYSALVRIS